MQLGELKLDYLIFSLQIILFFSFLFGYENKLSRCSLAVVNIEKDVLMISRLLGCHF